jgi:hypothetical protein
MLYVSILQTSTTVNLKVGKCYVPPCRPSKHVYIKINIYFNCLSSVKKCSLNKPHSNNTNNSI